MKEKAHRIEGKKTQKFSFEYDGKEYSYEIQDPTFDQLSAALSQVKSTGRTDVIGAGKVIWELCCVAHDVEIENNARLLISVCISLFDNYVSPIDIEVKKK